MVNFTTPFDLPADHYFFVPQVEITMGSGEFLWLSGTRPIVPPGTPFFPGFTDLQWWTRDAFARRHRHGPQPPYRSATFFDAQGRRCITQQDFIRDKVAEVGRACR
jgi:hypothetical protein